MYAFFYTTGDMQKVLFFLTVSSLIDETYVVYFLHLSSLSYKRHILITQLVERPLFPLGDLWRGGE